jgi:septum formation protein
MPPYPDLHAVILASASPRRRELLKTLGIDFSVILGKPANEAHAFEMLSGLSGKVHEVITAVCVKRGPQCRVISVSTEVVFRTLAPEEITAYIASGCPMDKAGAYAIQGGAAHMVRAINGSYTNVVGLPLCELHEMLISL